MHVKQTCIWKFLIFKGTFKMTVKVAEYPDSNSLRFDLVDSKFMKSFAGGWQIEGLDSGACRVLYDAEIGPAVAPPTAFAEYTRKIFVRQTEIVMNDLAEELERRMLPR